MGTQTNLHSTKPPSFKWKINEYPADRKGAHYRHRHRDWYQNK